MPKVKKIRNRNLPGTPWATSAGYGRPLLLRVSNLKGDHQTLRMEVGGEHLKLLFLLKKYHL